MDISASTDSFNTALKPAVIPAVLDILDLEIVNATFRSEIDSESVWRRGEGKFKSRLFSSGVVVNGKLLENPKSPKSLSKKGKICKY